jgi:hypothetical protein
VSLKDSNKNAFLNVFAAISFLVMVVVNALANILPINGIGTGAVSDSYPNLFAPAGLTFAIWGVIYLLLAAYTLFLLGPLRGRKQPANEALLRKTAIVFAVTSWVNTAWIFSWHYKIIPLSMVLTAFLLIALISQMAMINAQPLSTREKILIRLPFSVYFGWTTVATIANAVTLLVSLGWNRFGLSETVWAIIILAVGAVIGAVTILRQRDIAYGLVFIWAYAGILLKHVSADGFAGQYPGVIIAAGVCLALFAAAILVLLIGKKKRQDA